MESEYFYTILKKARQELEDIFKYISVNLSNLTLAENLIKEFIEAFERLCIFPFSCPLLEYVISGEENIRRLIVKNYVVLYRVIEKEIQILRIRHSTSKYIA